MKMPNNLYDDLPTGPFNATLELERAKGLIAKLEARVRKLEGQLGHADTALYAIERHELGALSASARKLVTAARAALSEQTP